MTYRQTAYDKSKQKISDLETIFSNLYDLFYKKDIKLSAFEIKLLTKKLKDILKHIRMPKKQLMKFHTKQEKTITIYLM